MSDKSLGWMAQEYKYITAENHRLIGVGDNKNRLFDNIGVYGENLTFAVLSMNRSSLTVKLMKSIAKHIPNFAGEFLIGDNGSVESEKDILREVMEQMPYRCRMIEFDQNYGVGGGRNRLFAEVSTDWILSLDNDIFLIDNPLEQIRQDIALMGCHFMTMPLQNVEDRKIFLYGGNLYVEEVKSGISIGGGSAYINGNNTDDHKLESFLCTFMAGGTCVLNKHTFFACGGYDEGMFVGFEDTEFSMILFQKGYKVGSCGICCLIHDHPKPDNTVDREYEKQRFSNSKLMESARYFEKKHGICVWNPMVEEWVNERLRELLDEKKPHENKIVMQENRPKVLLVVDSPGWALDNIAKQIMRNCSDRFEFKILYLSDITNVSAVFFAGYDCDVIHFLWRSWLADHNTSYSRGYASLLGMDPDVFYRDYVQSKAICTSVYDHLYLEDDSRYSLRLFADENSPVTAYSVSSKILEDIYNADSRFTKKPDSLITDGVDLELFHPVNLERFKNRTADKPLVVGWAGNSMWAAEKEDFKGLHTILKPAVEQLQKEGYAIELNLCDSSVRKRPHYEMPDYYAGIDLYVCSSKIEGTPNPILECMACGIPFVSTRVGIVPEAAGPLQSQYILQERSVECMTQMLRKVLENPQILEKLSQENLQSIQSWNWRDRSRKFIQLWENALKKKG